ncbi:MAG: exopolysaccharide biosynthesis polyprenyl glycosylphosphotransferase [Geminicoccaceae bacterium]
MTASRDLKGVVEPVRRSLRHLPTELRRVPQTPEHGALPILCITSLGRQPLIQLVGSPVGRWQWLIKDALDRITAAVALLVLMLPLAAIAAVIKLTSPGLVLYRQLRCGFNGKTFLVYKFRSMYAERCDPPDAELVRQASTADDRITPFGRLLRRTSLDELPQLLNVLKGEMSLVGPRPHALAHDALYSRLIENYPGRRRVKPGLTGLAQVNGFRGETDTIEKVRRRVELDLAYIERWSLGLDLRIILRTFLVGFVHPQAR